MSPARAAGFTSRGSLSKNFSSICCATANLASFFLRPNQDDVSWQGLVCLFVLGFPAPFSCHFPDRCEGPANDGVVGCLIDQELDAALQIGLIKVECAVFYSLGMILPELRDPAIGQVQIGRASGRERV